MDDSTGETDTRSDHRVRAAYDDADGVRSFVVADVSTDGAWLSVPAGEELSLEARR